MTETGRTYNRIHVFKGRAAADAWIKGVRSQPPSKSKKATAKSEPKYVRSGRPKADPKKEPATVTFAHLLGNPATRASRANQANAEGFADRVEAAVARAEGRKPRAEMLNGPIQHRIFVTGKDILSAVRAAGHL